MATVTLYPTATDTPDDWQLGAGASKVAAVAAPDDDATTYINSTATKDTEQRFAVTVTGVQVGDIISQIEISARNARDYISNPQFVLGYTFTPDGGGTQTNESGTFTSTNTWKTDTFTDSGLSVAWGSGLVIWIRNPDLNRNMRCSTLAVRITYTPTAAGQSLTGAHIPSTLEMFPGELDDGVLRLYGAFIDSTLEMFPGRLIKMYGVSGIVNMTHYEGDDVNTASFDHETPDGENRALVVIATYYDAIGESDPNFTPPTPYYGSDEMQVINYINKDDYFQGVYLLVNPPVGTHQIAFGPSGLPAALMITAISFNDLEIAGTDYTASGWSYAEEMFNNDPFVDVTHNRTYANDTLTLWSALHEILTPVTYTPQTDNEILATRNVDDLTYTIGVRYEATGATENRLFGMTASDGVDRKSFILIHLEGARGRGLWGAHIASTLELFAGAAVPTTTLEGAHIASTLTMYAGEVDLGPGPTQYLEGMFIGMGSPSAINGAFIASTLQMFEGEISSSIEIEGAFIASTLTMYAGELVSHPSNITAGIWPGTLVQV